MIKFNAVLCINIDYKYYFTEQLYVINDCKNDNKNEMLLLYLNEMRVSCFFSSVHAYCMQFDLDPLPLIYIEI